MTDPTIDQYAAGEQSLGYIYQPRLALLKLLQWPEDTSVFIEKDDDLDFFNDDGCKTLASLKHKKYGDILTDLSTDFWKSVRIWLDRYNRDGKTEANLRFFLFTTGTIAKNSFLNYFLVESEVKVDKSISIIERINTALAKSNSKLITPIANEFNKLSEDEKDDFLSRIIIFDAGPRIQDLPKIIKNQYMRTIRPDARDSIFERLEGWWNNTIVDLLTGVRKKAIFGYEVSDKLAALSDDYKSDNLPITFKEKKPDGEIDVINDPRLFVIQLREIEISTDRIRSAILDYYRAFEQRSSWARENLLLTGEMEDYEDRLVDEWSRYKDFAFEKIDQNSVEDVLIAAGRKLYNWADLESIKIQSLRIRERVTEHFVLRGGFHILANSGTRPKVFWHPDFPKRVEQLIEE